MLNIKLTRVDRIVEPYLKTETVFSRPMSFEGLNLANFRIFLQNALLL